MADTLCLCRNRLCHRPLRIFKKDTKNTIERTGKSQKKARTIPMKQKLNKSLHSNAISLEEFERDLSPEIKQLSDEFIRRYHLLIVIKQARKALGLSQQQLADKANLPRTTITKIESGTYNPTINTLINIATAIDKKLEINLI
jgi:DNA-binding XRE family transcriptional regulator